MVNPKHDDTEIPETKPEDWVGAAIRPGGERGPLRAKPGGMTFHVYRATNDHLLFAVVDKSDPAAFPPCPKGGTWEFFKTVPETGHRRIGFSEKEARADIERQGYHLNRISIELGEETVSSVAS
ncbi:MAG TPA: hypothetical protein VGA19_05815 [Rhodospirillales bacterium]|jgi:hypothetical protein